MIPSRRDAQRQAFKQHSMPDMDALSDRCVDCRCELGGHDYTWRCARCYRRNSLATGMRMNEGLRARARLLQAMEEDDDDL